MEVEANELTRGRPINRRLAPRQPVPELSAELVFDEVRSFGRRRPARVACRILDLSVEGALVAGPDRRELAAGATIRLEHRGAAVAEIRHRAPSEHPETILFGLRFLSTDEAFHAMVNAHLGRDRQHADAAWLRAR